MSTTDTVLPTDTYSAGTYTIPETDIPDGLTSMEIDILRCTSADTTIWPDSEDTISYEFQVSVAGVFQVWAAGDDTGGIHSVKGHEVATMNVTGELPDTTGRQFKGTITLGADIKTGASVTVS